MAEGQSTVNYISAPDETRTSKLLETDSSSASNIESKSEWDQQYNVLNSRLRKARLKPVVAKVIHMYYTEIHQQDAMTSMMMKQKQLARIRFLKLPKEIQDRELYIEPDYLERLNRRDEFIIVKKTYADDSSEILNLSVSEIDEFASRPTALYQDMLVQQSKTYSEDKITQREEKKGLFG